MAAGWVRFDSDDIKRLPRAAAVYALYRGDTLVYVGKSVDLRNRFQVYRRLFTYAKAKFVHRDDLARIERRLIRRLRPANNIQHTGRRYSYSRDIWRMNRERSKGALT